QIGTDELSRNNGIQTRVGSQYFLCHCHSHKKSLLLCTKRDRCDKLSCGTCPCCFNCYLFCDEMAYLIQTVDSADQSVDGSQNDVFVHTYAPVNFAVGISNGNISSCTGVGFCFQRMFCISYEGIVEAVKLGLTQSIADSVQTTVTACCKEIFCTSDVYMNVNGVSIV